MSAVTPGKQTTLGEAFERATEAAHDAESTTAPEDGAQDADELPCGHAPIYAESGTCMVCDQTFNTAEEWDVKRDTASDGTEGRL